MKCITTTTNNFEDIKLIIGRYIACLVILNVLEEMIINICKSDKKR